MSTAPASAKGTSSAPASPATTASAVALYSLCSASLLLVNKYLLSLVPSAPLVTAIQCAFCVASVGLCAALLGAPRVGAVSAAAARAYALYAALFVVGIYTNMKSLEGSNVDTVVVFRSAVPLVVALGDWALMGREAPSPRSAGAMLVVAAGCAAFVALDAAFRVEGWAAYAWVGAYVAALAAEMLLGKRITAEHDVSLAASVLLTNAFALGPFLALGAATGELARGADAALYTPLACAVLAASCALSAGIGFSSWWARGLLSATSFTVIGTVNKVITILLNILLWDKHASPLGTAALLCCLAGGALYQQAPLRAGYAKLPAADADEEAPRAAPAAPPPPPAC